MYSIAGEDELLEIKEPLKVIGSGGLFGNAVRINHKMVLAKDHPRGETPRIIKDGSYDHKDFNKVLDFVKDEKQVLILVDYNLGADTYEIIATRLPMNSFSEHHQFNINNEGAAAWVEHHLTRREEDCDNINFKFLIGDWYSTAGYEAPALIFITNDLTNANFPTSVQRAKAKLIVYEASELKPFMAAWGLIRTNIRTNN